MRSKRAQPSESSSCWTRRVMAGCVRRSRREASVKLPASAMRTKVSSSSVVMMQIPDERDPKYALDEWIRHPHSPPHHRGGARMTDQLQKAQRFLALHQRPELLLIPNPWDVGSARLLAGLGFEALATTSLGVAN